MGRPFKWAPWSEEELAVVKLAHFGKRPSDVSLKDLALELNREYDDVKARCSLLGLRRVNGCMVLKDRDEAYMKRLRELEG